MNAGSPSPHGILQLGMGFFASKTVLSAVELGIFTELAQGSQDFESLKATLGLHHRGARDFLDALVALRLLERHDGRYSNTPDTDLFLDRNKPSYIGGLLEMANARLYGFWGNLTEALKTGLPQNEAKGREDSPFEALYADPKRLEGFLRAMTGISLPTARAIAAAFPWKDHRTFVDVGCAQGGFSVEVARAHPHLQGIGFDLAPVGPIFDTYVAAQGLTGQLRFQAGNFFTDPLPKANVIVMGHILHDWDLAQKRELVRKAHDALPAGGVFLAYDAIIDDARRENIFGFLMSLNMLIETPGGFDYTGADCIGWMREAGFRDARVQHVLAGDSMVIGTK